jgi:hypothetical protein
MGGEIPILSAQAPFPDPTEASQLPDPMTLTGYSSPISNRDLRRDEQAEEGRGMRSERQGKPRCLQSRQGKANTSTVRVVPRLHLMGYLTENQISVKPLHATGEECPHRPPPLQEGGLAPDYGPSPIAPGLAGFPIRGLIGIFDVRDLRHHEPDPTDPHPNLPPPRGKGQTRPAHQIVPIRGLIRDLRRRGKGQNRLPRAPPHALSGTPIAGRPFYYTLCEPGVGLETGEMMRLHPSMRTGGCPYNQDAVASSPCTRHET